MVTRMEVGEGGGIDAEATALSRDQHEDTYNCKYCEIVYKLFLIKFHLLQRGFHFLCMYRNHLAAHLKTKLHTYGFVPT